MLLLGLTGWNILFMLISSPVHKEFVPEREHQEKIGLKEHIYMSLFLFPLYLYEIGKVNRKYPGVFLGIVLTFIVCYAVDKGTPFNWEIVVSTVLYLVWILLGYALAFNVPEIREHLVDQDF